MELALIFLLSAVVAVPLFQKLGLGSVLGYLLAGIIIGPFGLKLVEDSESILHFSELGVIFMMFIIGLELQPNRLWVMRKSVFGLGTLQVFVTSLVFIGIISTFSDSLGTTSWASIGVLGFAASLSSTALALQSLAERKQLTAGHGRDSFSVLLFQDLAVIPVFAIIPLLAPSSQSSDFQWINVLIPLGVISLAIFAGPRFLKKSVQIMANLKNRDLLTAISLLIVIGAALLFKQIGLSMALGAFLAGVLLSDSAYKHELESDIEPFKGLLLGLFFMAVGMSINLHLLVAHPILIAALVVGLIVIKFLVMAVVGYPFHQSFAVPFKTGAFLSQGSEFAFVLFGATLSLGIISKFTAEVGTLTIGISMVLAPLVFKLNDFFCQTPDSTKNGREFDSIKESSPVFIAGFGRFGQMIGRLLTVQKIPFTAIDKSSEHVDFVRRFGNRIFYGDATRLEILASAKIEECKVLVLAIDDVAESLKVAELVRKHYPDLIIYARARNRFHTYKLKELGIDKIHRETFLSSLAMGADVLVQIGFSVDLVARLTERFRQYDEDLINKQQLVYKDEEKLIQTTKQALVDLESLFESDSEQKFS